MMKKSIFAVCAFAGLASASSAMAQSLPVLLIVDNSDPSNVVFTATGNAPAINDSSATIVAGITLAGVFGGSGIDLAFTPVGGDLSPSGNTFFYNRVGNRFAQLTDNDLNLWSSGGSGSQVFSTGGAAFTGSTSGFNFGAVTFNASGDIRVGDTASGSGAVLGTWQLIPAPGTLALAIPFGFAAARRRR